MSAVEREEDLVLWFDFDEDIAGTTVVNQAGIPELNGEISGAFVQEDSPFGKALKFDGEGNKITVTYDPRLDVEYTVSVWLNSVKSNEPWVGVFGRPGRHYNLWAGNSNSDSWFVHHRYRDGGNGSAGPGDAGGLTHGEWWHVVLTNDGQQSHTYVNGEEKATANLSNLNYQASNMYIGANLDNGNGTWYDGLMDDVRLYKVAMTAEEVAAVYNEGNGDFNTPPVITIVGDASVRVPLGGTYTEDGVTVSDPDGDTLSEVRTEYIPPQGMIRRHEIVARWSFDVDGTDDIGNGNGGTLEGTALIEDAKFGKGLSLDGLGSYVSTAQFNGLDAAAGFSVSAWVKFTDLSQDGVIFATQGATDPTFFWVDTNSGPEPLLSFNAGDNFEPTNRVQATENTLQVDTWHHVVAVMDGKIRKVYVDGVLKGTETQAVDNTVAIHGRSVAIGRWDQVSMDLNGGVDEVRIYSIALSDEEVAAIYNDGDGDVQDAIITVDGNVLGDWIVRYSVDDSSGATTTADRKVRVFDPMAPVLTSDAGMEIQHEQGTPFSLPVVTARDAGGELIQNADITGSGDTVDPDIAGTYVLEFDYTDSQSRPAETLFVTVNVLDTTPPQLTIVGDEDTTHLVGHFYNDLGATAVDSVDGEILVESSLYSWNHITAKGYMLASRPETLMVFDQNQGLLPQDAAGEVVFDSFINFNGDASFQNIGSGITRNDNFQNLFAGVFRAKVEGEYEFGTDGPDDLATMWLDLNQNGVFELEGTQGNEWMTMGTRGGYSTVYLTPGVYNFAIGHMEGRGGSRVLAKWRAPDGGGPAALSTIHPANSLYPGHWGIAHPIDYNAAGTYTVTYTATDASGNSSTATRTVVIKDAIDLPVILLAGDPVMEIEIGGTFTEPGYTVESAFGDDLDEQGVVVSGTIDSSILGEQHIHYHFVDEQGIPAEPVTRTVRIVDTQPPELLLTGDAEITMTNAETYAELGTTVTDNQSDGILISTNLGYPTSGLVLHVDATILDLEDGEVMTGWQDLSGSSNHFNQVQGEPTFASDAINGMPAVEINGQDLMATSTSFDRTYSIFTVSILSGLANERMIASQNMNWFLGYWGDYEDQMHADAFVSQNTNPATTDPHLYVALNRNNNRTRFYADTEYMSYIPTRNGAIGMLQFGGYGSGLERGWGFISEVLVYDREVTEQERLDVQTYLNAKYGLNGVEKTPVPDFTTPGTYSVQYIAEDDSGNVAKATRTVIVTEDPEKPVIQLAGEAFLTLEAGDSWVEPGYTLGTIGGTDLDESQVTVTTSIDTAVPGYYRIDYTYDDGNGKVADPVSREVQVVDTTPPEITLTGDAIMTIEKGSDFTDPGATSLDIVDGDVSVDNNLEFPSVGLVLDLDATFYEGTLNDGDVVDSAWEDASGVDHHMDRLEGAGAQWIADGLNGEPVLRFNGDSYMFTSYNFDALIDGHTIITIARYSGGRMGRVISSDSRNWLFGFHGGYTGAWHAEGWIINTHNTRDMDWHLHSGIFIAEADPRATMWKNGELLIRDNRGSNNGAYKPGRLGIGAWNSATNQSSQCEVARVLVYDRPLTEMQLQTAETFLNARYSLNGKTNDDLPGVNVNVAGTYTIGYEATDSRGNLASAVRTIYVVDDIQAPVLTLNGDPEMNVTVDGTFTDPGVSITDAAGETPENLSVSGAVDTTIIDSYTLEYSYTSSNGKDADPVTRIVHVIDDVPPTLTLTGDSSISVILGSDYNDAGAIVTDNVEPPATVLPYPDGPASIYAFSDIVEGGHDSSGNHRHGDLQAGAMVVDEGKYGKGLFVPKSLNARLDLGGNLVDIPDHGEWSFTAWFKGLYPNNGNWRSIVSGNTVDYHVMVESGSTDIGLFANNRGNFRTTGFPLPVERFQEWHHLGVVGRGDVSDFYIDGQKVGTSDKSSTSDLRYIGNRGDWWFAEIIDEVYIYQRALSDSEVVHIQYAQPEINTDTLGEQHLAWFAVDAHGNRAEALRAISVIPDPDIRYIELIGEAELTIEAGESYTDPGATLLDVDGNVVTDQEIIVTGIPENTRTPGVNTIAYNSSTAQGKVSPEVTRVLRIEDTVAPVIELIGNNPFVLPLGSEFEDPGAIGVDAADGNIQAISLIGIPTDGLVLHLNAADIEGLNDGDAVTNWPDSSGANHPADNVIGDPTWHVDALNGQPVVRFDGDDILHTTFDFSSIPEFTVLLVARYTGGDSERVLSSRNGSNWLVGYWGNRYRALHLAAWAFNQGGSDTNWHLHGVIARSDAKVDFWVDRQLLAFEKAGSSLSAYTPKEIQLGGWNNNQETSKCEVAEVLYYDKKLDSSEMMVAQTVLDAKYGLGFGALGSLSNLDPNTAGIYNVNYVVADSSGNIATATRKITVLDPSILPVVTLNGDADITVEAGDNFVDPGATVSDPQGQPIDLAETPILVTGNVNILVPNTYTLAYDFLSEDRRRAVTVLRKVTVVDTTGPVFTLNSGDTLRFPVGVDFADPGVTVTDIVDGEVSYSSSLVQKNRILHQGFMGGWNETNVYLHDNKGILTLTPSGENYLQGPLNLDGDQIFMSAGVGITHHDNYQNLFLSTFHAKVEGFYEFAITNRDDLAVLWFDADQDGVFEKDGDNGNEWMNYGIGVGGRIVYLYPGFYRFAAFHREGSGGSRITAAVRTPEGAGPSIMAVIDPTDPQQDGLWNEITEMNSFAPGEHTIEYTATDSAGNVTTVTRAVIFESIQDAPILYLNGDREMTIAAGSDFTDPGATVESKDGNPLDASKIVVSGIVDPSRPGIYQFKYNFVDEDTSVAAKTLTRKVIVSDLVPPVLTLNGEVEITHHIGTDWQDPGATAVDNVDGELQVKTTESVPTAGLVLRLDAGKITGLEDGDVLSIWRDLSGSQNHLDNNIGHARYLESDIGGRPAIHFDGSAFYATTTDFGSRYSIAAVARYDGNRNNRLLASRTRNWIFGYHGNHVNSFHPNGWAAGPADWQGGNDDPHLNVATSDTTRIEFWGDGVNLTSWPDRTGDIGQFQIGAYLTGSEAGSGMVSEVLLYDRVLTTEEVDAIHYYLNKKYGLDGEEPVNGPVDPNLPGEYEILYSVIDSSGNEVTARRIVHVMPAPGAPVLTLSGESHLHHQANDPFVDPGAVLTDSDGNELDDSLIVVDNPVQDDVPGEYLITYNYTDGQGRAATQVSRIVTVADTRPPVITFNEDATIKISKDGVLTDPGATALDSRDGVVPAYSSLDLYPGRLEATGYQVYNESLLNLDGNQGLLVHDVAGPSKYYSGSLSINNSNAFLATTSGLTSGNQFAINYHGLFIATTDGTYEFGNNTVDDRMAFWLDLDQDGVFETNGDKGSESFVANLRTGHRSVDLTAGQYNVAIIFMENGGGERFEPTYKTPDGVRTVIYPAQQSAHWATPSTTTIDTSVPGTYSIEYVAIDNTGNVSTVSRKVVVVEDASLPFLSLNGDAEIEHEAGTAFEDPGAKATDENNQVLEAKVTSSDSVIINVPGTYVLNYTYTDNNQKDAIPISRTVHVIDTIDPVITLNAHPNGGVETVTIVVGDSWVDPGASVSDNFDQTIQFLDFESDATAYYSFSDELEPGRDDSASALYLGNLLSGARWSPEGKIGSGLELPHASRDARMEVGPIDIGESWAVTAWFKELHVHGNWRTLLRGQGADHQVIVQNNGTRLGMYDNSTGRNFVASTYNLYPSDRWQHIAVVAEGETTDYYIDGERVATIDAKSESDIWRIGAWPGQGFARLLDEIYIFQRSLTEGEVQAIRSKKGGIDTSTPRTYSVPYYAKDSGGNFVSFSRTVIVEPDPQAPLLVLNGEDVIEVEAGEDFTDPGATAKLEDDSVLENNVAGTGVVDTSAPGEYTLTYNYDDGQGKTALPITRTIVVEDTTAPEITLSGPDHLIIGLGDVFVDPGATAMDSFEGEVLVESSAKFPVRGLILDLDARSLRGVVAEGDVVSVWEDSSGSGNDMDNFTGNGATWHDDVLNGHPVLRLDGESYHWTTRDFQDLENGYTILAIARYVEGDKHGRVIGSTRRNWLFGYYNGNTASWHPEGWVYNSDSGTDLGWHLHAGKIIPEDDPEASFWKDGELRISGNRGFNNIYYYPGQLAIGAGRNVGEQAAFGEVSRILMYDRPLDDEVIEIAMRKLQGEYGLHGKDITDTYSIATDREGEHVVTYTAIDAAGNEATKTRTVVVMDNPPVPAITLNADEQGNVDLTIEAGSPFIDPGVMLNDRYGNEMDASQVIVAGVVDHTALGEYTLHYDFTDDRGFPANRKVRKVQVVDTIPPEITLDGALRYRLPIGTEFVDPGFSAIDNLDGIVPVSASLQSKIEGLLINWDFNDGVGTTLTDIKGGVNGTLMNFDDPNAAWVDGKYGKGLQFDGVKTYIQLPGTEKLDLQEFTFSVWFKSPNVLHNGFIFEKTTEGFTNSQFGLFFDSQDQFNFRINEFADFHDSFFTTTDELRNNTWHHIVATYDGQIKTIYIDGQEVVISDAGFTINTNPLGPSYIGAFAPGNGFHYNGVLDEIQVYDRALGIDDIESISGPSGINYTQKSTTPYVIEYTSSDSQGNTSTSQRQIAVSNDETPPTITLNGAANMVLTINSVFSDPGATASDDEDGPLTPLIKVDGAVDTAKPGVYTLTYSIEDFSFNAATPLTRTVQVGDPIAKWLAETGLDAHPAAEQDMGADPDQDQFSNLLEYALGSDPTSSSDAAHLAEPGFSSNHMTLVFLRVKPTVDPTIVYTPQFSLDLENWDDSNINVVLHTDQQGLPSADYERVQATVTIPADDERQFLRILISR